MRLRGLMLLGVLNSAVAHAGASHEAILQWVKNPSPQAIARKQRTEALLAERGIKVPPSLPALGTPRLRSATEVANRLLALTVVATKGEGLEQEEVEGLVRRLGATPFFTPKERAFVQEAAPSQRDRATFGWKYECMGVLLWALGHLRTLGPADQIVDAGQLVRLVVKGNGADVKRAPKLRSEVELLDAADLAYRQDWACVDARVNGLPQPKGLNCEVVVERHAALNWLIGYLAQPWDDVTTDT